MKQDGRRRWEGADALPTGRWALARLLLALALALGTFGLCTGALLTGSPDSAFQEGAAYAAPLLAPVAVAGLVVSVQRRRRSTPTSEKSDR